MKIKKNKLYIASCIMVAIILLIVFVLIDSAATITVKNLIIKYKVSRAEYSQVNNFKYKSTDEKDKPGIIILSYTGNEKIISVPERIGDMPVIAIESGVFASNEALQGINIPKTVETIGNSAFMNCKELSVVILNDGLLNIGSSAFESCKSLSFIELPESLSNIGVAAFKNCNSLSKITIPSGITSINKEVFQGSGLKKIILCDDIRYIGDKAFADCLKLKKINLPDTLESVGVEIFNNSNNVKADINKKTYESFKSSFGNIKT